MKAEVQVSITKTWRVKRINRRDKWVELEDEHGEVVRAYAGQPLVVTLRADLRHGSN